MNNLQWFRLYHRIIDDEKVRLIAFEDRWHFIAVCCLKADGLLDEPESQIKWRKVAVKMGVQLRELDEIKRRLFEVGLVDADMQPMAWDDLQHCSDTCTDLVRKYREKTKASPNETGRNVSVTAQETDTDTETEKEQENRNLPVSAKEPASSNSKRGTRLPAEYQLPELDRAYASSIGVPAEHTAKQFERFRDFWISKAGPGGVKLDWSATWRNWIRKFADERGFAPTAEPGAAPKPAFTAVVPGTEQWDAWYQHKRSTGTTRLMDAAEREGHPFPVPTEWPPAATATAA